MDKDIEKELQVMIRMLERMTYDESKSDNEYKGLTPKQFERNIAERVKGMKVQLNLLRK